MGIALHHAGNKNTFTCQNITLHFMQKIQCKNIPQKVCHKIRSKIYYPQFFFLMYTFVYCACCLSDMYIFCLFPTFFVLCAEVLNDSFIYIVVEWAIQFLLKNVNENG